eukprot:5162327-Amphidinium_carterae.1
MALLRTSVSGAADALSPNPASPVNAPKSLSGESAGGLYPVEDLEGAALGLMALVFCRNLLGLELYGLVVPTGHQTQSGGWTVLILGRVFRQRALLRLSRL